MRRGETLGLPATHDIAVARKDFSEGADGDVAPRQDLDVGKGADRFVYDDGEAVLLRQLFKLGQIGASEKRVRREFCKERERRCSACCLFSCEEFIQSCDVFVQTVAEEITSWAPFLKDFECVSVREPERSWSEALEDTTRSCNAVHLPKTYAFANRHAIALGPFK